MKVQPWAVSFLLVTALSQAVTAAPYPPGAYPQGIPTDKAVSTHPGAIIKAGINKLRRFIKSGRAQNREQAQAFMMTEIEPYFDFEYMTRSAAGPVWRRMSPQQRATAQDKLKNAFMNTLAQRLLTHSNQPIRYYSPRGQGRNDVRIHASIMQASGIPIRLEFRFYRREGEWKIFDVKVGGNSAVAHYRNQFRRMFQSYSRSRWNN